MECPSCNTVNVAGAKFCVSCGTKLVASSGKAPKEINDQPHAERRQLSVLFSDLVGSTELSEKLDPEDLRTILHEYQVACTKVVALYEGYLAKYLGDGILAYFGYPIALEDDARRAIQAGLGIVDAVKSIGARFKRETGTEINVRVGVHTGLVVVGDMDKTNALETNAIVGQTPNLAARLQSIAEPNTLVTSGDTYKLIRGYFETVDLGAHELKGISQAVQIYRIDHESTARSRLDAALGQLTPFAGRDNEIRLLEEGWHRAQEGKGQIALVGGEAGVGKSRLLHSIKQYATNDPDSWLTELRCSAYHANSSFFPVIDFLERIALRLERDDLPAEKLAKIEGFLTQYGFEMSEAVPLLAGLLSVPVSSNYAPLAMTPQRQKIKTIDLLIDILLRRSEKQPVLFIIEDLHWADPSSLELLDRFLLQAETHHVLVLLTYRPQFKPYWHNRSDFLQIELTGLPKRNCEEIIRRVASNKTLPKEAIEYILSKTDGIPLFLEELTKSMVESEMLVDHGDHYELSAPLASLGVPSTIQDSLTARLDRLPEAKNVAQLAATIGREFSYEILESIPGAHTRNMGTQLERLVQAGILYQKGFPPHATYSFKHALIQDSAYSSLLKTSRKDYHRLIAESLETHSPELIETQPELLAQHYTKAVMPQKAIQYWVMAGVRALQRSANAEAIAHLKQGLELTDQLTDQMQRTGFELQLHSAMGPALIATRGFADPEIGQTYKKAGELSAILGDGPHLFTPLWGQWVYYLVRGDLNKAQGLALEMKRLGKESDDAGMLVEAYWTLGNTEFWLGNFDSSIENLDKAVEIYDPARHHINAYFYGQDPGVAAHCYRLYTLWSRGFPDKAYQAGQSALTLAESLRHPFSIGWALAFQFTLNMLDQDHEKALVNATKTAEYCVEQAYPFWLFAAMNVQGWAISHLDSPKKGLPIMEQGLDGWNMIGSVLVRPAFLNLYAEALCLDDQLNKALEVIDGAITLAKEISEVASEVDLYRVRGNCLQLMGRTSEAEESIRFGHTYAKRIGALSREMTAAISLSKILTVKNQKKEGIALVKETLAKFDEGFDTAFMREAKSIIET